MQYSLSTADRIVSFGTVAAFALAGCTAVEKHSPPTLVAIDSVQIGETETLFVGKPNAMTVGADGAVYISDVAERRVLRANRDGSGLVVVAAKGGGPGEVELPTALTVLGDTLLVVKNSGGKRLELFELPSLRFRGRLPLSIATSSLSSAGDLLLVGALAADSGHAFALLTDSASPSRRGGTVPEMYRKLPPVAQAFGTVEVARDDSTILGIFEVSNTMYRWRMNGSPPDSLVLTVQQRRGARPGNIEELVRDPTKAPTLAFSWSFPMLIAPLSEQRSAVVFYDPTLKGQVFGGPAYVQVADWRSHKGCAEIALPVPTDTPPRYAMRGDTLLAIVQHSTGATGASTWVVRWRIGAGRCV